MLAESPLTRIPLLCDTLITLLMFGTAAGLGSRLVQWLRVRFDTSLEKNLFGITLGLGLLSFLPFVLFALGIGTPLVVTGATLLVFVLVLPDQIRLIQEARHTLSDGAPSPPKWVWAAICGILPLILFTWLNALCPPTDPDGLHYHLTAPLRYLSAGGFYYMPTFLHVHWPLGIEMLFGVGLAFHAHYAVSMVQFGIGIVLLFGVYGLGRRLASPAVGWIAVALTFFLCRFEMSWAYIDLGMALYTLMAAYAVMLGWQEMADSAPRLAVARNYWRAGGILAGLTATAKLPGLLTIGLTAMLIAGILYSAGKKKPLNERLRFALLPAVEALLLGILVAAPWLIRSWVLTGAPVYPYFGGLFGAKDWSPEWQKRLNEYFQMFNTLRSRRLTPDQVVKVRAVICLALAALGAGLCWLRVTRRVRPLIVFVIVSLFLQVATSGVYFRYFLPVVPLTTVLVAWAFGSLLDRWNAAPWVAVGACMVLLWGGPRLPSKVKQELTHARASFAVAAGQVSRDTYLTASLPVYPVIQWCNNSLPDDAIITLGVMDCYAGLFKQKTLATNYYTQQALRYDSDALTLADLKRLKANYLLIQENEATPEMITLRDKEGVVRDREEFSRLKRIGEMYGRRVYAQNGYGLYALTFP